MKCSHISATVLCCICSVYLHAQQFSLPVVSGVEPQPLLAQSVRLEEALRFLGSALPEQEIAKINELRNEKPGSATAESIQAILDRFCIAMVEINPEARVKTMRGPATPKLLRGGWTSFLVKIKNEAGVTSKLEVHSPQTQPLFHMGSNNARPKKENMLTDGEVESRFLEMSMYRNPPLLPSLSGLKLEYAVLQIYSRTAGRREAQLGFHVGQGTQDIGFRNSVPILFDIAQPVRVRLSIKEENGTPAMASLIFRDNVERMIEDTLTNIYAVNYRVSRAQIEYRRHNNSLKGIYPLPSRRLAATDEYPDFFFQPQVYRYDGDYIDLPPGKYSVTSTRGPEYIANTDTLVVEEGIKEMTYSVVLKRWIDLSARGWHSADHHVHAAGCSHYESPEEGVVPEAMWRQQLGEDLDIAAVLTWGPGWYHQKQFFSGKKNRFANSSNVLRYDVEVSGFPSSHAGHLVLIGCSEDDYPGTQVIEDWPSWTLPVLQWAKSQGALTGYAHSGWGLEPVTPTNDFPNYVLPKMDGIGANEYVVTVTQNLIDFYSAGDTPLEWELNMWYHTLNCGYRTRISGETDFPCVYDERVGLARSYVKLGKRVTYEGYLNAIKEGRSYVSDGRTHIVNFTVNGKEAGTDQSELNLNREKEVTIKAEVAAYLSQEQSEEAKNIAKQPTWNQPHWHIERARIGDSHKVAVELIVNGIAVDSIQVSADGRWKDVAFKWKVDKSSWIALRIKYGAHTNPYFVNFKNLPVAIKESAEWCRNAVEQCWKQKQAAIREHERPAAAAAYERAKRIYERMME